MRHSSESEYNMQGLGQLLQLYGGAAEQTEEEYRRIQSQFQDISKRRKEENNKEQRRMMKQRLKSLQSELSQVRDKLAGYSRGAMNILREADKKLDEKIIRGYNKFKEADRNLDEKFLGALKKSGNSIKAMGSRFNAIDSHTKVNSPRKSGPRKSGPPSDNSSIFLGSSKSLNSDNSSLASSASASSGSSDYSTPRYTRK